MPSRNFSHAILRTRKFSFRVSWNFILTIYWPRCISIAHSNTNNTRPTKPGMPTKSSRKSDFHLISGLRAIHSFLFGALRVKNARERRAQEISLSRNLRDRGGRGGCRGEGARRQSHGGTCKWLSPDVELA